MDDSKILITGAKGQLGLALQTRYPNAKAADRSELDISDSNSVFKFDWSKTNTIINTAGYTDVDGAETAVGRVMAWKVNALAVANLAKIARERDLLLIHISTDYVFDGSQNPHYETEPLSPLSVYGASKAAGDLLAKTAPKHCLLRTTWVVGEGKNFVRTMLELGKKGMTPTVVHDQVGRLTFASEMVNAIDHLLNKDMAEGTYNVSNDGEPCSWADISRAIFHEAGFDLAVTNTTTAQYYAGKLGIAPRPLNSVLDLNKLKSTGFESNDWQDGLKEYIKKELGK